MLDGLRMILILCTTMTENFVQTTSLLKIHARLYWLHHQALTRKTMCRLLPGVVAVGVADEGVVGEASEAVVVVWMSTSGSLLSTTCFTPFSFVIWTLPKLPLVRLLLIFSVIVYKLLYYSASVLSVVVSGSRLTDFPNSFILRYSL